MSGGVELGVQAWKAYKTGDSSHFNGDKVFAKSVNGAIFGGTVAATAGASLLPTALAYTGASVVGGAVERKIDGDPNTKVADGKAVLADVIVGAGTGIVSGVARDAARVVVTSASKQALTRAQSLLRQALEAGDPAKIAKRTAQLKAVQDQISREATANATLQRTAIKTAAGAVLKPKEEDKEVKQK